MSFFFLWNAGDERIRVEVKDSDPCFRAFEPSSRWCCELVKPNKCYPSQQACHDNCH